MRGVSVVREFRGVLDVTGGESVDKVSLLNTSPLMNGTGNESCEDSNSSWPMSQNSLRKSEATMFFVGQPSITAFLISFPT